MSKRFQVSEDIVPLAEFKAGASRVIRRLREGNRVVVITQNGKPACVLLTPQEFDRLQDREAFGLAVQEGLRDSDSGRLIDDADLTRELDAAFDEPDGS